METIWDIKEIYAALNIDSNINPPPLELLSSQIGAVKFNSTDINRNDIFIVLPGKRDAHQFILDAFERGASLAIINKIPDHLPKTLQKRLIIVEDSLNALNKLALYKRKHSKAKIIAITGSYGKTSTKEAAILMLNQFGKTYGSKGNYNNHLGLPLSLASMPNDIEYAIFELGMNGSGEIEKLSKMLKPDIGIITSIYGVHLKYFNSVADIALAKSELWKGMNGENNNHPSCAIINIDSEYSDICLKEAQDNKIDNIIITSMNYDKNHNVSTDIKHNIKYSYYCDNIIDSNNRMNLSYEIMDKKIEFSMDAIQRHFTHNFIQILSLAHYLGLDLKKASEGLSNFSPIIGRGKIININDGINNCNYKIICDYYNSNPKSLKASLAHIKQISNMKKLLIIGDIGELSENEVQIHKNLAKDVLNSGADHVILVGKLMSNLYDILSDKTKLSVCVDYQDVLNIIGNVILDNQIILIKGSRFMKLEKIAEYLGVKNAL